MRIAFHRRTSRRSGVVNDPCQQRGRNAFAAVGGRNREADDRHYGVAVIAPRKVRDELVAVFYVGILHRGVAPADDGFAVKRQIPANFAFGEHLCRVFAKRALDIPRKLAHHPVNLFRSLRGARAVAGAVDVGLRKRPVVEKVEVCRNQFRRQGLDCQIHRVLLPSGTSSAE
ncbi:hypothetical protein SDC9_74734 [bioreactor metagenome]|uniref:Uncharacterized protein n=1 Tax=bioreactor metagenome TaxID=1076179 RepID=A0A644YI16_9ZZZZ